MQRTGFVFLLFALGGAAVGCGGAQEPATAGPGSSAEAQGGSAGAESAVAAQPEGFFTLTPSLVVSGDVDEAVAFYTEAFGATKRYSMPGPDGATMHAEIQIGDSIVMIGPEMEQMGTKSPATLGGTPASLTYYVEDVDAVFAQAVAAGATPAMPPEDMFWGDRYGKLVDPYGHQWGIATRKEDLTGEQIMERAKAAYGGGEAEFAPGTPAAKPIPDGYHSLTPGIVVGDARAAIEFYKNALGATERWSLPGPDGRVMHAELQVGDSVLILSDEYPEMGATSPATLGGTPFALMVYVADVDAAFDTAVEAGATARQPPADMFWGDRYGEVVDPSGHQWGLATHKEDLTPEQIMERMKAQYDSGRQ